MQRQRESGVVYVRPHTVEKDITTTKFSAFVRTKHYNDWFFASFSVDIYVCFLAYKSTCASKRHSMNNEKQDRRMVGIFVLSPTKIIEIETLLFTAVMKRKEKLKKNVGECK